MLGAALGMNNALASVGLGATQMKRSHQLRAALVFAAFEALMPVIGVALGAQLSTVFGTRARLVGIGVLVVAGLYGFFKAEADSKDGAKPVTSIARVALLAVALSLDNLTVGFGLGMFHVPVYTAAITFGCVSLVMTLVGLEAGRYLGNKLTVSADKLSGVVLLVTAGLMWLQ